MYFKDNLVLVYKNDNSRIAEKIEGDQEYIPLRALFNLLHIDDMNRVLKEYQMYNWNRRSIYCGACGTENIANESEGCKDCPNCAEKYFPAQFPAVIVLITRDDEILLAHNTGFSGDMHSVIAGFVDLGENLEECLVREIKEEVGLEVDNIEYFGSQNWGFSSALMIAFKARYKSGEITIDGKEIDKAAWFNRNNLPELPPTGSIGRKLIDHYINN